VRRPGRRRIIAVPLVAVAIVAIVIEPFPHGVTLLSITGSHGIEAGDLPAVLLLLVAGWLAV
jgi:hypothetical protein